MKNIIKCLVLVIFTACFTSCASKFYSDGKTTKISGPAAKQHTKKQKIKIKSRTVAPLSPYGYIDYGYRSGAAVGGKPDPVFGRGYQW
ncbi:MAG: hypothetical protein KA052_01255 [Candidatus Pacebacteria bacterium]|nr:hypothetical protein [Candidatus Paceibacterota bacterium]